MYAYEKWQPTLAAIELYLMFGADLLVVPIASVIRDIYTILRAYEQSDDRLRLWPAIRIAPFVSKTRFFLLRSIDGQKYFCSLFCTIDWRKRLCVI